MTIVLRWTVGTVATVAALGLAYVWAWSRWVDSVTTWPAR